MRPIVMAILVLFTFTGIVRAQAANPKDLVKASFLADVASVQPGTPFKVGVMLKIAPHWHVYWSNSGDAGIPTVVHLKLPEGFVASAIQYPVPSRIVQDGNIIMYGYSDEVMLMATITPPSKIEQSNVVVEASANWLVCDDSCIPGEAPSLRLSLPIGNQAKPAQKDLFDTWSKRLPMSITSATDMADHTESIVASSTANHSGSQWTMKINWKEVPSKVEWFPPASEEIVFGNKFTIQTTGKTTTIIAAFDKPAKQNNPSAKLQSVLSYQTPSGRVGVTVPVVLTE